MTAVILVLLGLVLIVAPTAVLMTSLGDSIHQLVRDMQSNSLRVPPPPDGMASWPIVGQKLHTLWAQAHADLPALVLLAPYLSMLPRVRRLARLHPLLAIATVYVFGRSERSILDPEERRRNLGYGYTTPRLLAELRHVADLGRAAATRVLAPTLVVQSRDDHRIRAADAEVPEEDPVQLVIVVLAGMDQHVARAPIELGNHPRELDQLRAGAHDGHYLQRHMQFVKRET